MAMNLECGSRGKCEVQTQTSCKGDAGEFDHAHSGKRAHRYPRRQRSMMHQRTCASSDRAISSFMISLVPP